MSNEAYELSIYVNELGHVYQTMTGSLGNFSGGLFSKKK